MKISISMMIIEREREKREGKREKKERKKRE